MGRRQEPQDSSAPRNTASGTGALLSPARISRAVSAWMQRLSFPFPPFDPTQPCTKYSDASLLGSLGHVGVFLVVIRTAE